MGTVRGTRRNVPASSRGSFARRLVVLAAALALLAALPYLIGGVSAEFVTLDDGTYIYENPQVRRGLNAKTALWALRSTEQANWYPLRRLSHLVDVSLFGLEARRHHQVSILWHAAAAALLGAALAGMTGRLWRSFAVAGLFAVHPLQVESVAWASERSSVLSGFFLALALLLWTRYVRRPGAGRYAAAAGACALGLMSKPVLVPLPLLLLLLDYWPLGRLSAPGSPPWRPAPRLVRARLLEKAPLLLLAVPPAAVAVLAHEQTGSLSTLEALPPGLRLGNAAVSYVAYIRAMVWPAELAVLYPHPAGTLPASLVLAALAALALISALALWQARRRPWLGVGWFWYAGLLVPVSGVVQFGAHARADRFVYLPLIGICVALVWAAAEVPLPGRWRRPLLGALTAGALAGLLVAAAAQAGYWKDSETLFRRTLALTENNWVMRNNLAGLLVDGGRSVEALEQAREAVRIRPRYPAALSNLGLSLAALGRPEEALAAFREALRLEPQSARTRLNLGLSLAALGRREEAILNYREALRIAPDFAKAHASLGTSLAALGRREEALLSYREALRIDPDTHVTWTNLGVVLAALGRPGEAAASFQRALGLRPGYAEARAGLAQLRARGSSP